MSKRRILHIKNTLSYDGATIVEYRLAELLNDEFVFDWFLISDEVGGYEEKFKRLGSVILHCSDLEKNLEAKFPSVIFYKFLKENKYDVVYFDTDFSGRSYWLLLARLAGVKKRIVHSHASNTEGGINPILHWFFRQIMRLSVTDYIACSKEAAFWLFPKQAVKYATILPNGIDSSNFQYNVNERDRIRKILDIPADSYAIGHVGRFSEVKNHNKLIRVFDEFHTIYPDSFLILVGDGELRKSIEQFVDSLELSKFVRFIGNTDDVYKYLSAMDIFILPSSFEGLGISAIEAECSGLNVYISDGVPDDAMLTPNTKKIPLSLSDKEWAFRIADDLKQAHIDRVAAAEIVRSKGYDIKDSAETLRRLLIRSE